MGFSDDEADQLKYPWSRVGHGRGNRTNPFAGAGEDEDEDEDME